MSIVIRNKHRDPRFGHLRRMHSCVRVTAYARCTSGGRSGSAVSNFGLDAGQGLIRKLSKLSRRTRSWPASACEPADRIISRIINNRAPILVGSLAAARDYIRTPPPSQPRVRAIGSTVS